MTLELIFGVVQALVTAVLGAITKKTKVPKYLIPLQNVIIGIIAGILSIYFELYNDSVVAIFVCLAVSMGVGGTYDAMQTKKKIKEKEWLHI